MIAPHQKLPASGPVREALRSKGQFWTPDWIAAAMVSYVIGGESTTVFDPAVGTGSFFKAAKNISRETHRELALLGTEIDPDVLRLALKSGLSQEDITNVQIRDFVLSPPQGPFDAIVANPPYIRHHRLSHEVKAKLRVFSKSLIGSPLDGRAGLHVYFLLRALESLDSGGRLAFILPADTFEGIFAPKLWNWITRKYCLEAIITFSPDATPFPNIDTNPVIILIKNVPSKGSFLWARCLKPCTQELKLWIQSGFTRDIGTNLIVCRRQVEEALITGLTRPETQRDPTGFMLGDFVTVLRGIATGANHFFFLTRSQVADLKIPEEFLIPAIGRTRDISGDQITLADIEVLDRAGRPTLLFSPDGRPISCFPPEVQRYLEAGERMGVHKRKLISIRHPWYKMEVRAIPPILFAYLGRRNARFIYNQAGVVPLTGFLCIYPRQNDPTFIDRLWQVLRHPETVANLALVGKSYGDGAIKVEPRALEKLPLPTKVVEEAGLCLPQTGKQLHLFE